MVNLLRLPLFFGGGAGAEVRKATREEGREEDICPNTRMRLFRLSSSQTLILF